MTSDYVEENLFIFKINIFRKILYGIVYKVLLNSDVVCKCNIKLLGIRIQNEICVNVDDKRTQGVAATDLIKRCRMLFRGGKRRLVIDELFSFEWVL